MCVVRQVRTVGGSRHVPQTDDVQPLSLTVRCLPGSLGGIGYFSFLSLLRTSRSWCVGRKLSVHSESVFNELLNGAH